MNMVISRLILLFMGIFLLGGPTVSASTVKSTLAVVISKSPTLTESEKVTLGNLIGKGFADSGKYQIVDPDVVNKMLEDEVVEALLLGKEDKLNEIQEKYQVDVLINASAMVESIKAIGGYSMASSTATINSRLKNSEVLFNQKTSEPQNGFLGIPEWLGVTEEGARKVSLLAALADIFQQLDLNTIQMPLPISMKIKIDEVGRPGSPVSAQSKYEMTKTDAERTAQLAEDKLGSKSKITCSVLDSDKRIAVAGVLKIDIDLQRHRRLDIAEFQVFDFRKGRLMRSFELPRKVKGIRRPRSREITDIAIVPTGRFLALVSKHPAIWIYDILNGTLLYSGKTEKGMERIEFSQDGTYLITHKGKSTSFYRIQGT